MWSSERLLERSLFCYRLLIYNQLRSKKIPLYFFLGILSDSVEACVAGWLTPQTLDLEVWDSTLARHFVSLDKELYSTLSLFTQVYKWVPATYFWGATLQWTSIPSRGE